jgi:tRNA modification GTPase
MKKLGAAEVVLAVAEATDSAGELEAFAATVKEITGKSSANLILVVNKIDLIAQDQAESLMKELTGLCDLPAVAVSAKKATGIDDLRLSLLKSVDTGVIDSPQYIVTNARHYEALKKVSESLQRVLDGFRDGIPTVLIATDVRQAIYYLGLITGRITPEDILGEIFSRFCIGK